MIASTTWSLTEMCASHLKISREDIDPEDLLSYLDGDKAKPTEMVFFVQHCEMDSYFQMAISSKVQMLPLTKQLTNLAGNSWYVTVSISRYIAECRPLGTRRLTAVVLSVTSTFFCTNSIA